MYYGFYKLANAKSKMTSNIITVPLQNYVIHCPKKGAKGLSKYKPSELKFVGVFTRRMLKYGAIQICEAACNGLIIM